MSTQVKGAVLLSRSEFVRSEYGDAAWQQVLAQVSPASRPQLEGLLLSSQWYAFEINADLDRAIVEVLGHGDRSIFKKMGAKSAQANLGGPPETLSANDCLTVIGWYEEALRMCGATTVRMTEETCRARGGPYCRYQVSWSA